MVKLLKGPDPDKIGATMPINEIQIELNLMWITFYSSIFLYTIKITLGSKLIFHLN